MVPVNYSNGEWVVADSSNSDINNLWYDYANGKWANAVVVSKDIANTIGTEIKEEDILGQFVWIPRYRYKLWNYSGDKTDSYNAYDNGINIIFENGLSKMENTENDKYTTHKAFADNLRGFWVSKYEISKVNDTYKFINGTESYRNDTIENYEDITSSMSNTYNLGDTATSHIISNLEWGAILYLSHSKYGVCKNNGCDAIGINDSYISGNNKQDTTTKNVYGVYDIAGGSSEYVTGDVSTGSATSEVVLSNGDTWYEGHGLLNGKDYLIRGGRGKGLFYFGDIGMNNAEISTRMVITSK